MPSVQDRNGEDIQDHQVDADHGHEEDQAQGSRLGLLPGQLSDENGTADRFGRDLSLKDFDDADGREFGDPPALDDRPVGGGKGIEALDEGASRRGNPDQAHAHFIAKNVLLGGDLRRNRNLEFFFVLSLPSKTKGGRRYHE